jgi:hypothetical protein
LAHHAPPRLAAIGPTALIVERIWRGGDFASACAASSGGGWMAGSGEKHYAAAMEEARIAET